MALKTIKQLQSSLTALPVTVATGDTVKNLTLGTLTIVIGKEVTVGKASIFRAVEGSAIDVLPGETSAAITLAAGEKAFALDTYDGGMASTADKLYA